ncbi:restriction endonuclease subunit S [Candidatus Methylomirabilis limnetica]|nr:restriction endonuclease subunit S [Candidatus Methylomirabilis limnetica]
MAGSWQRYRIGELGKVLTGRTPPGTHPDYFGDCMPFLTPTDMDGRRKVETTGRSLSQLGVDRLRQAIVPHGVAVSCIGWQMGKPLLVDRPVITNQQINSIVADRTRIEETFLYYALLSKRNEIFALGAGGSRTPILNKSGFESITIEAPPLPEQRAIAHILGALDDKIELNRRMNETLEAMARALFKSWFVAFDPVRAKAEGQARQDGARSGQPRKPLNVASDLPWPGAQAGVGAEGDPGLPQPLANLFPDSFQDSELGEIPMGWRAGRLDDVLAELVSGARPKGGAVEEGVPSIGAENVIGLGRYDFSKEKYVPQEFFERLKLNGAAVRAGDVLLYKDGAQIGRKTYFDCDFPHAECAINEHVFILRPRRSEEQRFLFFWLDQASMTQEIVSLNSNSAQPGINQPGVRGLPVLLPKDEVVDAFDQLVARLTARLFANCKESRTLAALRDTLLPKLISGALRIDVAERLIKEPTI